jgi:hypothetical protein
MVEKPPLGRLLTSLIPGGALAETTHPEIFLMLQFIPTQFWHLQSRAWRPDLQAGLK